MKVRLVQKEASEPTSDGAYSVSARAMSYSFSGDVAYEALGKLQKQRDEDDDEDQVHHRQHGAVADIRAIAILAIDEAGHRNGQHEGEGHLPEALPGIGAIDLGSLEDLLRHRLQAGKQHDHHEGNIG